MFWPQFDIIFHVFRAYSTTEYWEANVWMRRWTSGCINSWIDTWMDPWMIDRQMDAWMNGGMYGWVHGWMNRWMDAWADAWMDEHMDEWMHWYLDGCTDTWMIDRQMDACGYMDEWMDAWISRCIHEWMDGQTDACMYVCMYACMYACMYPAKMSLRAQWARASPHQTETGPMRACPGEAHRFGLTAGPLWAGHTSGLPKLIPWWPSVGQPVRAQSNFCILWAHAGFV